MKVKRSLRRMAGFFAARLPELGLSRSRDPRDPRGRRWNIGALLTGVVLGLMAGANSLSELEDLTANMTLSMRRLTGIARRMADTTLRDLLCRLGVEPLRAVLHRVVAAAIRRKALPIAMRLPFHVAAMDGKATAITAWNGAYAQRHVTEQGTPPYGLLRTVTTTLATGPGKPCIDVSPIPARTNEMGHFQTAFTDVVTYDAGAIGEENAAAVVRAGKDYLFHMANEERHMTQLAGELLATMPVVAETHDVLSKHKSVVRTLRLMTTHDHSRAAHRSFIWPHTRTILRVDSETRETDSAGRILAVTHETRLYCSSLAKEELLPAQWLLMVRLHWTVETTHQILDTALLEDERPWIVNDANGALAVLILRRVVYTLLTLFRSVTQRSEEKRAMPWKQLLKWVERTLTGADLSTLSGLRNRKAVTAAS
jgi:hypothetical protein